MGLEHPTLVCIELLGSIGNAVGLLGLVGVGGIGKTTLASEIYNHHVGISDFRFMMFLEIHGDSSTLDVQVRSRRCGNLREQLLWDLLHVRYNVGSS